MGFETANIHLGSKEAIKAVRRDLGRRKPDWLHEAVHNMTKAVLKDWEEWKKTETGKTYSGIRRINAVRSSSGTPGGAYIHHV
jgi:hypothetical protein